MEQNAKRPKIDEALEDVVYRLWQASQNYQPSMQPTTKEPVNLHIERHGEIEELRRDDDEEIIFISDDI